MNQVRKSETWAVAVDQEGDSFLVCVHGSSFPEYKIAGRGTAEDPLRIMYRLGRLEDIEFTRVPSDSNGNPRYAIPFSFLLKPGELSDRSITWDERYRLACKRANAIGGRRYNTKKFHGYLVFQSYGGQHLIPMIETITGRKFKLV